jgi:hypothetical protein
VRTNRNGIPILDPPREANKLRPSPCRIPEDHDWGPPAQSDEEYDYILDDGATRFTQKCRRCGTTDSYWVPWRRNG